MSARGAPLDSSLGAMFVQLQPDSAGPVALDGTAPVLHSFPSQLSKASHGTTGSAPRHSRPFTRLSSWHHKWSELHCAAKHASRSQFSTVCVGPKNRIEFISLLKAIHYLTTCLPLACHWFTTGFPLAFP